MSNNELSFHKRLKVVVSQKFVGGARLSASTAKGCEIAPRELQLLRAECKQNIPNTQPVALAQAHKLAPCDLCVFVCASCERRRAAPLPASRGVASVAAAAHSGGGARPSLLLLAANAKCIEWPLANGHTMQSPLI